MNSINNPLSEDDNVQFQDASEISISLGSFMGNCPDVLGIGIYNLFGNALFSSAKNLNGDVGLTAFKSLLGLVGSQIDTILPAQTNIQFIAPNDILVGVSKISNDKVFAVILNREAQISNIIPNIAKMAKLLQGISSKTGMLSSSKCLEVCNQISSTKKGSKRRNLVKKFGA
ncbi:MAG: hypothetical protein U9O98_10935 [Asgard group archaeon]|nr:hypothetical protein [Asgard group archaeon]